MDVFGYAIFPQYMHVFGWRPAISSPGRIASRLERASIRKLGSAGKNFNLRKSPRFKLTCRIFFARERNELYIPHIAMNYLANVRRRVSRVRQSMVLGEPPKKMRYAVMQTRAKMRQLTEIVCKVHRETSLYHLGLIEEWAEYEVTRRSLWMEWRDNYDALTTDQRCMLRRDTQKAAEGKSRCLRALGLDLDKIDAFAAALTDDGPPTIESTPDDVPGDGTDPKQDGGEAVIDKI